MLFRSVSQSRYCFSNTAIFQSSTALSAFAAAVTLLASMFSLLIWILFSIFFHSLSNFAPSVSTPAILFASARVFAVSAFASCIISQRKTDCLRLLLLLLFCCFGVLGFWGFVCVNLRD